MVTCIYQSAGLAAYFGLGTEQVLNEAAQFLLGQLTDERLQKMIEGNEEIEVSIRCSAWASMAYPQGFYLEVSALGEVNTGAVPIIGGDPEELIEAKTYIKKFDYLRELLIGVIVTYEEVMECDLDWVT